MLSQTQQHLHTTQWARHCLFMQSLNINVCILLKSMHPKSSPIPSPTVCPSAWLVLVVVNAVCQCCLSMLYVDAVNACCPCEYCQASSWSSRRMLLFVVTCVAMCALICCIALFCCNAQCCYLSFKVLEQEAWGRNKCHSHHSPNQVSNRTHCFWTVAAVCISCCVALSHCNDVLLCCIVMMFCYAALVVCWLYISVCMLCVSNVCMLSVCNVLSIIKRTSKASTLFSTNC